MKPIKCKTCRELFTPTEHWMKVCEDCFREGRYSVKEEDSDHPALVYEREHANDPVVGYSENQEHVARCIANARAAIEPYLPPPPKPEPNVTRAWMECSHPNGFKGMVPQCHDCGIFEDQYGRYINEVMSNAHPDLHASETAEGGDPLGFS